MAFWDALRAAARPPMLGAGGGAAAPILPGMGAPNGMAPTGWLPRNQGTGDPNIPFQPPGIVPQPWEMAGAPGQPPMAPNAGMPPQMPGFFQHAGMTPEMWQQAMFAPRPTMATSRFPPSGSGSAYGPMGSAVKALGGGIKF